jgi:3-dehydroquinate dehydratase-1
VIDYVMANDAANIVRVRETAQTHGVKLVLSFHNFAFTPTRETLITKFLTAENLGADVAKVAVMPKDPDEALSVLHATREASKKLWILLISMSIGSCDSLSRLHG